MDESRLQADSLLDISDRRVLLACAAGACNSDQGVDCVDRAATLPCDQSFKS